MNTSVRSRATGPPLLAAGVAGALVAVLSVRDPRTSTYLPCPIHAATGLWCPGCGATRAFGDLIRGDVASAISANLLAVVLAIAGIGVWGMWMRARMTGTTVRRPPAILIGSAVVVVCAFTILRNVPAGSWLAP
ncbi:DUF2752 domain-containing protein [Rhodococcoides yunnanense]|uniref:DUF2752 domain-containing protein n=1 Tax=Rhodococcoides yunnanense TaxID=278209 RepID=UPI00093344A4|nr:DUF2752 domain-containing protein [Rhodococcus yunnanensis]